MIAAHQVLEELQVWTRTRSQPVSAGFPDLELRTDGFAVEQVWVITSRPGHGRSTLALNLALNLANGAGWQTNFVSARDHVDLVSARLLAAVSGVPVHRLRQGTLTDRDRTRVDAAVQELHAVPLRIETAQFTHTADLPETDSKAVIIDDFHLTGYRSLNLLREGANRGSLVIVTAPRHHILIGQELDPTWAELSDVIIDIERPDASEVGFSARPSEADLHILRNRAGPQATITVAFQGHRGRFISRDKERRPDPGSA